MKPGRNEPCPCGSGKKYKHCCLMSGAVAESAPVDLVWRRLRGMLGEYGGKIFRFATQTYGIAVINEAWCEFTGKADAEFDADPLRMQLFMPWFYYTWTPESTGTPVPDQSLRGKTPADAFMAAHGRRLDPLLRRYIESLRSAPITFFEVLSVDTGRGMRLLDVLTREEYTVTEQAASKVVQPGVMMFGQLASVDDLHMLEANGARIIPPIEKIAVIELRTRIAAEHGAITREALRAHDRDLIDLFHEIEERLINPQMPELQNTDGELLVPHKVVFDLKVTPRKAFDALKHLAMFETEAEMLAEAAYDPSGELSKVCVVWHKAGNKMHAEWDNTVMGRIHVDGARLVAEVNSQARAAAARELIEKHLGGGVRYRVTETQSMEKMLADAREQGGAGATPGGEAMLESARLAEMPEVRAKVNEMMAAHWERWPGEPVPMLGDRTPLEAVKDADGREMVDSLIAESERRAKMMKPVIDPAIFLRLRARLGLEKV